MFAQQRQDGTRIAGDARVNGHAADAANPRIEVDEGLARNLAAHVVVAGVAEDADDLRIGGRAAALAELPADRMRSLEVVLHERFVDEAELSRPAPVAPPEVATHLDRDPQRLEVTGRDGVEEAPRHVAIPGLHAGNGDLAVPAAAGQQPRRVGAHGLDAGHGRQALDQRAKHLKLASLVVLRGRPHAKHGDVLRRKAEIDLPKIVERPHEQAGTNQQEQRQRHLQARRTPSSSARVPARR